MQYRILILSFLILNIKIYSQKYDADKTIANTELENGNYSKSISLYSKLITTRPNDYENYVNRGYCYYRLSIYKSALKDLNTVLNLKPDQFNKYYAIKLKGHIYYELDLWDKALKELTIYTDYNFEDLESVSAKALALYKLKKYDEAIREYNFLLNIKEIDTLQTLSAYSWLGFCYLRMDSLNTSKKYLQKTKEIDTLSVSGMYLEAAIKTDEKDYNTAIQLYTKILSIDSTDLLAIQNRGKIYNYDKKYDMALIDLRKCEGRTNNKEDVIFEIAKALCGKKNHKQTISYLMDYLKKYPNSSGICNAISWTYLLSNDYPIGLIYADRAIKLDSKNSDAYSTKGTINYRLKKYDQAIKDFDLSLKIDSTLSNSIYFRGLSYIQKNDSFNACKDWHLLLSHKYFESLDGEKPIELLISENCNK